MALKLSYHFSFLFYVLCSNSGAKGTWYVRPYTRTLRLDNNNSNNNDNLNCIFTPYHRSNFISTPYLMTAFL